MKSNMTHSFANVPNVSLPRSSFNRSHAFKTTFDAGKLIPIFLENEIIPGDTVNLNVNGFARLATPIYPTMDNMRLSTFFFFIPYRILYENWKKLCGEQIDPGDSIAYNSPKVTIAANTVNETLPDYFGLPTYITDTYDVNAWAFRSYNKCWNNWFRDENLQDSLTENIDAGPDPLTDYTIQHRGKRHDYFTSALPFLQKGDSVELALGTSADVLTDGSNPTFDYDAKTNKVMKAATDQGVEMEDAPASRGTIKFGNSSGLYTDLSTATASTINELREAVQVQALLEKDARSGTRYPEIVKSHFGVTAWQDSRLQRPEYLGGGVTPVNIIPIARTDSSPGEMGALGEAAFKSHGFTKSFSEHGCILGLASVSADITYQEGIDRSWLHDTRYDYYWPTLANLGEQAILNKEIYIDAATIASGVSEEVFGYQERYAHLRYKKSIISGKFKSNDPVSLDSWHLGVEFGAQPLLDDAFIEDTPPVDRIIGVPSEPHFKYNSYVTAVYTRPLPTYSIPGFGTRF